MCVLWVRGKYQQMRGKFQAVPGLSYCLLRELLMSSTGLRKICAAVSTLTASHPEAPPKVSLSPKGQREEHQAQSPAEPHVHINVLPAPGYLEHT